MKIKCFGQISIPRVRRRDGALLTHVLHLQLTTDEALALSEMFAVVKTTPDKPTVSLIRAAMLVMADQKIDEDKLIRLMAERRTKEVLAEQLSKTETAKALALLANNKNTPTKQPPPLTKPARRVWVNPDANKRR